MDYAGGLRTAYPFCWGSRHHSYRPTGPCWLITMLHPKWGLIQSAIFAWGRAWTGRGQIPSIICREKRSLCRAPAVPLEPWYWDTSLSWKAQDTGIPPRHDQGNEAHQKSKDLHQACGFWQIGSWVQGSLFTFVNWRGWPTEGSQTLCTEPLLATQAVITV